MHGKLWLFVVCALVLAVSGCEWKQRNEFYCPPGRTCPPVGGPCATDGDCPSSLICNTNEGVCAQCTTTRHDACVGMTPACGDDGVCRSCQAHSECPGSDACLPDGSCADPGNIAYVKPTSMGGSDNAECTFAKPCTKVASALGTNRPYVKIAGTNNESATITIDGKTVALLAEADAKLVRTSPGTIIEVRGTSRVEIYDLEISGASGSGANGAGIAVPAGNDPTIKLERVKLSNNQGSGVFAADGGSITITRSTITGNAGGGASTKNASLTITQSTFNGNIAAGILMNGGVLTISRSTISGNQNGGVSLANGTFVVVGNVFFGNGNTGGTVGGIAITTTENAMNRLEFNSFSSNLAQSGIGPAVQCVAGTFTARNNIMNNNGTLALPNQTGGGCGHAYSIIRPGLLPQGTENSSMDPLFENEAIGNLHLKAGSPALSAAAPDSVLTDLAKFDIDGDERKARADIGADEVP